MKNFFILSALISFAILTSCNKQAIEDSFVPVTPNQESSSLPDVNTKTNNLDFGNIEIVGKADFTINNEDNTLNEQDVLLLSNNSIDAVSYHWDFGNGHTSTEAHPTYKYEIHGFRTVTLTITDSFGNTHQTSDEILVLCLFGGGNHDL